MRLRTLAASLALVFAIAPGCGGSSKPTPKPGDPLVVKPNPGDPTVPVSRRTALDPKPITDSVKRGLAWLGKHQLENGSWGQGDESTNMSGSMTNAGANVADSSMALIA